MFIPIYLKITKYLIETDITTRCQRRRDNITFHEKLMQAQQPSQDNKTFPQTISYDLKMRESRFIYKISLFLVRDTPPYLRFLYHFLINFNKVLCLFYVIRLNYIGIFILLHHLKYNNDEIYHDPLHFSLYYIIWSLWTHFLHKTHHKPHVLAQYWILTLNDPSKWLQQLKVAEQQSIL